MPKHEILNRNYITYIVWFFLFLFLYLLVCELCHSISKPINDEEDTFKSFMTFNITPREPLFRMIVGSQIVVPSTIPPPQWHFYDSNPWPWLSYYFSNRELCHSTLKLIGDEKDTLKSFMTFNITPRKPIFRVVVECQIVTPQQYHNIIRHFCNCTLVLYCIINSV